MSTPKRLPSPLHDCGKPGRQGPMIGVAGAHWNHRAKPGDRLVCCACGYGKPGTDEEVAQAALADAAWEKVR